MAKHPITEAELTAMVGKRVTVHYTNRASGRSYDVVGTLSRTTSGKLRVEDGDSFKLSIPRRMVREITVHKEQEV